MNKVKKLFLSFFLLSPILLSSCNSQAEKFNLEIQPNIANAASFTGEGEHESGRKVTVGCTPNDGYKFDNWIIDSDTINNINYNFTMPNHDLVVKADLSLIDYPITYELDGGNNSDNNPTFYNVLDEINLDAPQKEGFHFIGWENTNGEFITKIEKGTTGDLMLRACWEENSYNIFLLSDNNGTVSGGGNYKFGSEITITASPNVGYKFDGWYENDCKISENSSLKVIIPAKDVTYKAKFSIVLYSISYDLDGGINDSKNPTSYTIESNFTLYDPSKLGYTFIGWYKGETKYESIEEGMYGDLRLVAHWSVNSYSVSLGFNNNYAHRGTVSGGGIYPYGSEVTLTASANLGYKFEGWYTHKKISSDSPYVYTVPAEDTKIIANFNCIQYSISYDLDGGINDSKNPTWYTIENNFTLYDPTKLGYTFIGWYNGETKYESIEEGMHGDLTLVAHWSVNSYSVIVVSNDLSRGTVSGGGTYDYGSEITLTACPSTGFEFDGWFYDNEFNNLISSNLSYKFILNDQNITIYGRFLTKAEQEEERLWKINHGIIPSCNKENNTITYGLYPQTHVNDPLLISALDNLNDSFIDSKNGWYFYNGDYYAKTIANPYSRNKKFDDGTIIVDNSSYWFKCETISWRILEDNSGPRLEDNGAKYYLISSKLLDAHNFDDYSSVYFNNSSIDRWLSNEFYNSAFSLDKKLIKPEYGHNIQLPHINIFEPYWHDYFQGKESKCCKTTDWARANFAYLPDETNNGDYWTESWDGNNPNCVYYIDYEGEICSQHPNSPRTCVRPTILLADF